MMMIFGTVVLVRRDRIKIKFECDTIIYENVYSALKS